MINKDKLIEKCSTYGIQIEDKLAEKLDLYAEILVEYNKKVNLTAITLPEEIEDKHFIDCLIFSRRGEVKGKMVDVGTGAGFPGVVTKLYKPEVDLYLMDPTGKRIDFLKFLCKELQMEAEFVKERAEEAARKEWREMFDVATARAVAALPVLAEYCIPLVKPEGYFIAMKGSEDESEQAENAAHILGATLTGKESYFLPNGEERMLLVYKKVENTNSIYPRNGGKIAKKPL
jgi:16S rRNA (guanine(527)-N(7))-methyltransferase GidB